MDSHIEPRFISSKQGNLFTLHYLPGKNKKVDKYMLYIPAFAEEMNKSRRMVGLQARVIAMQGYGVLELDLSGTGDSAGDFGEATWETWLQNIATAMEWINGQGAQTVSLWGLRIGALLAMDFISRTHNNINQLICWQPVLNGEMFIMQFLRLRIASAMMEKNAPQEKTSDLRRQLQDGHCVEVAGYLLNPDLIKPMIALRAQRLNLQNLKRCNVFELVAGSEQEANHATKQWIDQVNRQGLNVTLEMVSGSSFWATQEIAEVPELIKATTARII